MSYASKISSTCMERELDWMGGMKKLKVRRALQVTAAQQLWYHRPAELGSH